MARVGLPTVCGCRYSCTLSYVSTQDRVPVTARLSVAGLAEIDRMAQDEERDRSAMIRILLREAVAARQKRGAR